MWAWKQLQIASSSVKYVTKLEFRAPTNSTTFSIRSWVEQMNKSWKWKIMQRGEISQAPNVVCYSNSSWSHEVEIEDGVKKFHIPYFLASNESYDEKN